MGRVGVRRGSDGWMVGFSDEGGWASFVWRTGWIKVTDDDDDVFVLVVIDKKILLG